MIFIMTSTVNHRVHHIDSYINKKDIVYRRLIANSAVPSLNYLGVYCESKPRAS